MNRLAPASRRSSLSSTYLVVALAKLLWDNASPFKKRFSVENDESTECESKVLRDKSKAKNLAFIALHVVADELSMPLPSDHRMHQDDG